MTDFEKILAEKDKIIAKKDKEISELKERIHKLENQLDGIIKILKGKKKKLSLNFFPKNMANSSVLKALNLVR